MIHFWENSTFLSSKIISSAVTSLHSFTGSSSGLTGSNKGQRTLGIGYKPTGNMAAVGSWYMVDSGLNNRESAAEN